MISANKPLLIRFIDKAKRNHKDRLCYEELFPASDVIITFKEMIIKTDRLTQKRISGKKMNIILFIREKTRKAKK